jgi:hypothetical protein
MRELSTLLQGSLIQNLENRTLKKWGTEQEVWAKVEEWKGTTFAHKGQVQQGVLGSQRPGEPGRRTSKGCLGEAGQLVITHKAGRDFRLCMWDQ